MEGMCFFIEKGGESITNLGRAKYEYEGAAGGKGVSIGDRDAPECSRTYHETPTKHSRSARNCSATSHFPNILAWHQEPETKIPKLLLPPHLTLLTMLQRESLDAHRRTSPQQASPTLGKTQHQHQPLLEKNVQPPVTMKWMPLHRRRSSHPSLVQSPSVLLFQPRSRKRPMNLFHVGHSPLARVKIHTLECERV
jgi:hypothetical protein